uniref:Uncharacterized protein n=1 Tax=viral metagenome TaxID=1070528 RepID=A0A6M3X912_9ZZZZ
MIMPEVGLPDENEEQYYRRINVGHLSFALKLLDENGRDSFVRYCRSNNFSADDIERVEWKQKYSITGGKIMKKLSKHNRTEP